MIAQVLSSDPHFLQAIYLAALSGAGLWAIHKADEPMVRTFTVLLANWLVIQTIIGTTHDATPIKAMIVCDFIAAVIVMLPRVSTMQIWIGEVFFVQLGIHTGMMIAGAPAAATPSYLVAINALGWLQIIMLLIGTHYGTGKRIRLAGAGRGHGRGAAGHARAGAAQ